MIHGFRNSWFISFSKLTDDNINKYFGMFLPIYRKSSNFLLYSFVPMFTNLFPSGSLEIESMFLSQFSWTNVLMKQIFCQLRRKIKLRFVRIIWSFRIFLKLFNFFKLFFFQNNVFLLFFSFPFSFIILLIFHVELKL